MSLLLQAISYHWAPVCVYFLWGLAWVCGIELAPSSHYSTGNSSKLAWLQASHSSLYRCLGLWPRATWMRTKNSFTAAGRPGEFCFKWFLSPMIVESFVHQIDTGGSERRWRVFFFLLLCFHYLRYKTHFFMQIEGEGEQKSETKLNPTLPSLCFVHLMLFVSFLFSFCSCRGDFVSLYHYQLHFLSHIFVRI